MMARLWQYHSLRLAVLAVVGLAVGASVAPVASAGELDKLDASLKLIPADAAFYCTKLRNRETFEAIRNSNAWKKIEQMPAVQMSIAFYQAQVATPDSGPAKIDAALKNPETRKSIDLALDMISNEVFVYGDDTCTDFLELFQNVTGAMNYGPIEWQAKGLAIGQSPDQFKGALLMSALAQNVELIGMPNMVFGFKVKNLDLAKEQLIKLEAIGNVMFEMNEKTKGHFKKSKIGDYDFLVLDLDGSMVPWEQTPLEKCKELEVDEGDTQKVIDRLKESKLTVALGLRGDYLLLMIGSSLDTIEALGQGDRLIDRKEFKPLEKYVAERLIRIGYISEEMNECLNNQSDNIDNMLRVIDLAITQTDLTEEQSNQVEGDLDDFADDLKSLLPEWGPAMGFCYLTTNGVEGYQYTWGDFVRIDGSKRLDILDHMGGNPLFGIASRAKTDKDDYETACKWAKKTYGYFVQFGLPAMPEADRKKTELFLESVKPLFVRLDKANREKMLPALVDGQSGFVFDGKLKSNHFIESLPSTEKPMPMLEPALVMGVSDAKLLKEGLHEYKAVVNEFLDAVRKIEGAEVPEWLAIPDATVAETQQGTIYSYTLPNDWGVDKQIQPQLAVGADVAVIALSKTHAERLLNKTPLTVGGVLQKTEQPMGIAMWFDWAAFLDTASPWIDFATDATLKSKGIEGEATKPIVDQVHTAVEVLKSIKTITGDWHIEDDVLVTHTMLEIHDTVQ